MSTAIAPNQPSSSSTLQSYANLLQNSSPIQARIKACVARLQTVKGRTISLSLLDAWVEQLSPSDPTLLAAAFNRVEREIPAFPDVAHVVQILERVEFDAAFAVVLRGIPRHTVEWKDRNAYQDPGTWDMHSEAALKLGDRIFVPGKMHEAEPAPVIHPKMVKALGLFGADGDFHRGLRRLARDSPYFWDGDTTYKSGDHGRIAGQIERDLLDCWKRAA